MAEDGESPGASEPTPMPSRPRFWMLAAMVIAALFLVYWLLLRTVYVPVLVNLDPQDASDVAKVLEAKKIDFRFQDESRTIAVSSSEADRARVELAGSELPMKGQIGFELFNQSDMGLTEFAQQVNYQRALQGELARTILLFEGIQTVRVHLGLPERSLFRGEQVAPKASVTLVLKPGRTLSAASVDGIQRLVAAAVPDLGVQGVAVLDGTGRVVSPAVAQPTEASTENDAVLENAKQRVTTAIARAFPNLRVGVNLSLRNPAASSPVGNTRPDPTWEDRDYAYSLRLTTERPLEAGRQADLRRSTSEALALDVVRGDSVIFLVGPIPPAETPRPLATSPAAVVASAPSPNAPPPTISSYWWLAIVVGMIAVVGFLAWQWRRRYLQQRRGELSEFAQVLRDRLESEVGGAA